MLTGIETNEIIAGAYTDEDGICPMLAAHRAGSRNGFISFAEAWDRFAFREPRHRWSGTRRQRTRRATERELLILRTQLEASLLADDVPAAGLRAEITEHQQLQERRRQEEAQLREARHRRQERQRQEQRARQHSARRRPGDPDRSSELGTRAGWRWMRVVRRYDDYQRALARLEQESARDEISEALV